MSANDKAADTPTVDGGAPGSLSETITKHRDAADIANAVLKLVIEACRPNADIAELCAFGDAQINAACDKVYTKKEKGEKVKKGVAFPTCVTPNELCAHYSPSKNQPDTLTLKQGDVAKICLGCHIDGYIAVVGHTIVVSENPEQEEVVGRKADVIQAAYTAAEVALAAIAVGTTNTAVADLINKTCDIFKCKAVCGISSHEMKQHVIDGAHAICPREASDEKTEQFTFGPDEVYGVNIVVSTGEGKVKESDHRTWIYQRNVDQTYSLKTKLARQFFKEVQTNFPSLPFALRNFDNENSCRVGISEGCRHGLIQGHPVTSERPSEVIAQFQFTVCLLPTGKKRLTGFPLAQRIKSEAQVADKEILDFVAAAQKLTKKKKKGPRPAKPE